MCLLRPVYTLTLIYKSKTRMCHNTVKHPGCNIDKAFFCFQRSFIVIQFLKKKGTRIFLTFSDDMSTSHCALLKCVVMAVYLRVKIRKTNRRVMSQWHHPFISIQLQRTFVTSPLIKSVAFAQPYEFSADLNQVLSKQMVSQNGLPAVSQWANDTGNAVVNMQPRKGREDYHRGLVPRHSLLLTQVYVDTWRHSGTGFAFPKVVRRVWFIRHFRFWGVVCDRVSSRYGK